MSLQATTGLVYQYPTAALLAHKIEALHQEQTATVLPANMPKKRNAIHIAVALLSTLFLIGCASGAQAPDFLLLGSFFPSWLIGALIAVPVTMVLRALLIKFGLDDFLPLRFFVYVGFWLIFAMLFTYVYSPR